MAKELPYFKFEPGQWDTGNIQMCSRDSKGLFVDICSLYWSRLGEVPYALALQKLCNGSKDALQELIDHEIIGIIEGQIVIEFLDEQLEEFNQTSEKRRKAANKRWKDASALQVESKSNAIREEKRRVEETKLEKREEDSLPFLGIDKSVEMLLADEYWHHSINHLTKGKDLGGAIRSSFAFLESQPNRFKQATLNDLKKVTLSWLENKKPVTIDLKALRVDQKERLKNL